MDQQLTYLKISSSHDLSLNGAFQNDANPPKYKSSEQFLGVKHNLSPAVCNGSPAAAAAFITRPIALVPVKEGVISQKQPRLSSVGFQQ